MWLFLNRDRGWCTFPGNISQPMRALLLNAARAPFGPESQVPFEIEKDFATISAATIEGSANLKCMEQMIIAVLLGGDQEKLLADNIACMADALAEMRAGGRPPIVTNESKWTESWDSDLLLWKNLRGETKGSKNNGKMETKWDSRDGLNGRQPTASRCDSYL